MATIIKRGRPMGTRQRRLNFRQVKQVQKIVDSNKQLKRVYGDITVSTLVTTGSLTELTVISKGDENFERDTDRIRLLKAEVELGILNQQVTPGNVRLMLVRSKVGPLVAGDFPTSQSGTPDFDKMQVYHDRLYSIHDSASSVAGDAPNGGATIHRIIMSKSFKTSKIPHLNVIYDTDESATAAQDNPIYLWMWASQSSNGVNVRGRTIIKWFDKD